MSNPPYNESHGIALVEMNMLNIPNQKRMDIAEDKNPPRKMYSRLLDRRAEPVKHAKMIQVLANANVRMFGFECNVNSINGDNVAPLKKPNANMRPIRALDFSRETNMSASNETNVINPIAPMLNWN